MFIFASDNGPEFRRPWRGTAGPWTGTYHTAMEGALRVPFMVRWPGHVPAGGVSNEIVHVTDIYTTLAHIAGAALPSDRPIDGVDQRDFFFDVVEVRGARVLFLRDDDGAAAIPAELVAIGHMNIKRDRLIKPRLPQPDPIMRARDTRMEMRGGRIAGVAGYARVQQSEPIIMHEGRLASPKLRCFDLAQTDQGLSGGPSPERGRANFL